MGRRKISIKQIVDPKLRHITFNKRKNGLIKKAAELSLLCNINMLLIFEDGNGNLIQFSKNKLVNIPSFFQECRYSNVLEFVAKDYPNFFKVNHYKKTRSGEDDDDFDQDDLDDLSDTQPKVTIPQGIPQTKTTVRKDRIPGVAQIKEEDRNRVFHSGSEESSSEGNDELNPFVSTQVKTHPIPQQKNQIKINNKPNRPEEKQKIVTEDDLSLGLLNEQEVPSVAPKDSFQTYKDMTPRIRAEKPVEYPAQAFMGLEAFKRGNPMADQGNAPFRFYPTENALNAPNPGNNTFVNNPAYNNGHPYMHNPHGYQAPNNGFQNNVKNNRMRGFGPLNMGNIPNEETLNAMLKSFPSLGFALGGGNPFMNKPGNKAEMDDKYLETANMIKLMNGTAGGNPYTQQKIYSFHPNESGKPEEVEQFRNNQEGNGFEHEHEYPELPPYMRGDYRMDGNMPGAMPNNLPSAYFSSKKFNFDGYFNTFEDERFNEFGDAKKKLKQ